MLNLCRLRRPDAQTRLGEHWGRELKEAAEQVIPPPVLVLDGLEGRQIGDAEAFGEDLIRLGDPQLDDRRQLHDGGPWYGRGYGTTIGESCQTPLPCWTHW